MRCLRTWLRSSMTMKSHMGRGDGGARGDLGPATFLLPNDYSLKSFEYGLKKEYFKVKTKPF